MELIEITKQTFDKNKKKSLYKSQIRIGSTYTIFVFFGYRSSYRKISKATFDYKSKFQNKELMFFYNKEDKNNKLALNIDDYKKSWYVSRIKR